MPSSPLALLGLSTSIMVYLISKKECICSSHLRLSCFGFKSKTADSFKKVRLVPSNMFKPSSNFLTVPRRYFFRGSFLSFVFRVCLCHTVLSVPCSLVVNCWEGRPLGSLVCNVFLVFCHIPIWYTGSGVVFDCIDS